MIEDICQVPLINPTCSVTSGSWRLPTLTDLDINQYKISWEIEFVEEEEVLIARSGRVSGKKIPTRINIVPKANRTLQQQAIQQARRRYLDKQRKGYRKVDEGFGQVKDFLKPMLAQDYTEKRKMSSTIIVQPKLDGQRLLSYLEDNNVKISSRSGVLYNHITHFHDDIMTLLFLIGPDIMLDGEMYIHGMPENEIGSIIMKGVGANGIISSESHERVGELEYNIFDYKPRESVGIIERTKILKDAYQLLLASNPLTKIKLIKSEILTEYTYDILLKLREKYEDEGFEGIMIKQTSDGQTKGVKYNRSLYASGRRVNTLKFKSYDIDIATVMKVIKSEKKDGICVLEMKDNERECIFRLSHGTHKQNKEWIEKPDLILGQEITYKHQGFSTKNIPRFPTTKL